LELLPEYRDFIHHTYVNFFLKEVEKAGGETLKKQLKE